MENLETGYCQVENGKIYYEVAGKGDPLVLIHAGIADCTMWDEQFALFSEHFRVIRYDTRGFGKSLVGEVSFSSPDDLRDLLDYLQIEKSHVLGVSRGGQIAIDFALQYPQRVSALIPVASGLGGFQADLMPNELALFEEADKAVESANWERLAELDVRIWVDGPSQPEGRAPEHVRNKVYSMCLNGYQTHKTAGLPRQLSPPAVQRLGEISVPTLVICGELDVSTVGAAGLLLQREIRGARLLVLAGTAHMPSLEKPAEFNAAVLGFLGGLTT